MISLQNCRGQCVGSLLDRLAQTSQFALDRDRIAALEFLGDTRIVPDAVVIPFRNAVKRLRVEQTKRSESVSMLADTSEQKTKRVDRYSRV